MTAEEPGIPAGEGHALFVGTVSLDPETDALKALLKLKRALAFAQRFEPEKLDEQHRAGKRTWELGIFLGSEVPRAAAKCSQAGIRASFLSVG